MNISLLVPRRKRNNHNWLRRLVRLIADYRYFRARGFSRKAAWFCARNTL